MGAQAPPTLDTSGFLPAVRDQIEKAEADARAHPGAAAASGRLGMTLHAYLQYEPAGKAYARAHHLDPANFDWIYLLGSVQLSAGVFTEAAASFRSAQALSPEHLPAQLRLGQSLSGVPDWDEAAGVYRKVLEKHPGCPQAWYGLGRAQAAVGDHLAATESYRKACDLFPPYGAAHFALAAELRKLGRKEEAAQQLQAYAKDATAEPPLADSLFERIHELNRSAQIHLQKSVELERSGRLAEAIHEQEEALAIDPSSVQAHINLISLYGRMNDFESARQHFEAAVKINPGRSDAWYNYGVLLVRRKKPTEAANAFRQAVGINPSYAEAHYNLGVIHEQAGLIEPASREFSEAITGQPTHAQARFHLARILVNQGRYADAIQQFTRALDTEDEQTPVYLYALAATYARAGNRSEALRYFGKARDAATARGLSQLLTSIDRDVKALGVAP